MKIFSILFLLLGFSQSAQAGHLGVSIGPSIMMPSGGSDSTYLSYGFDAAINPIPTIEVGGFFDDINVTSATITMIGAELNFYPLVMHTFYVGVKLGNGNEAGNNCLIYGPGGGFNYELNSTISLGASLDYIIFNGESLGALMIMGNLKVWF